MSRKYQYKGINNDDVDMEERPSSTQEEDGDGDDVPQFQVTMVNEKDLEGSSKLRLRLWILTFYDSGENFLRQNLFNPCVQLITLAHSCINSVLFTRCSILNWAYLGCWPDMRPN